MGLSDRDVGVKKFPGFWNRVPAQRRSRNELDTMIQQLIINAGEQKLIKNSV